jgi:hypothetical protein
VKAVVFLGPTLPIEDARRELQAEFKPPVSQGDVYRAALSEPDAIVIIDGEFDHVPAVWHKEILWAMSRGVHVYGAASMGALRAAELCDLGMEGVGTIFEAYRDGTLEDDDEVAVAHLRQAAHFQPTSEAMVNIRATLDRGCREAIIGEHTRAVLERAAKNLFFPMRSYPAMLESARHRGGDLAELARFADWWPHGGVDQKRRDAIDALCLVRTRHAAGLARKRVDFVLEHTTCWQQLLDTADLDGPVEFGLAVTAREVIDELWLNPVECVAAHERVRQSDAGSGSSAMRLLAQLRTSDCYPMLLAHARQKHALLEARGLNDRGEGDEEIETAVLLRWHAAHPADDSLTRAFRELARTNWHEFLRALVRQHYYEIAAMESEPRA